MRQASNKTNKHTTNEPICVSCIKRRQQQSTKWIAYRWPECKHVYCIHNVNKTVTNSLIKQNQRPKCIYSNCNQIMTNTLNNNDYFKQHYFIPDYNNKHDLIEIATQTLVVYGYIRRTIRNLPIELKLMIDDFLKQSKYQAKYFKHIKCWICKGHGFQMKKCVFCEGTGDEEVVHEYKTQTMDDEYDQEPTCDNCQGKGVIEYQIISDLNDCNYICNITQKCFKCKGTGIITNICQKCEGSGIQSKRCTRCCGLGHLETLNLDTIYKYQSLCNGCKRYYTSNKMYVFHPCKHKYCIHCYIWKNKSTIPLCKTINCSGEIHDVFKCKACNRENIYHWNKDEFYWSGCCHKYSVNCANIYVGMCATICCKYDNCNELLNKHDAIKVLGNHSCKWHWDTYCKRCGAKNADYYRREIFNWPECNHSICSNCLTQYFLQEVKCTKDNQLCLMKGCYTVLLETDKSIETQSRWENKTVNYFKRENLFECDGCGKYHLKEDIFIWDGCGHVYSKTCTIQHIMNNKTYNCMVDGCNQSFDVNHDILKKYQQDCGICEIWNECRCIVFMFAKNTL